MLAWGPFAHPTSSFNTPVPLPGAEPDQGPCATVSFSRAWLPYVLGAMTQLLLQTTWATDDPDEFRLIQEQASTLIAMFAEQGYEMNGCCDDETLYRFGENGILEQSTNGGLSWSAADAAADPRQSGVLFPPLPVATGTVTRCAAADNMAANFERQVDQFISILQSAEALGDVVTELVVAFGIYLGFIGVVTAVIAQFAIILTSYTDDVISAAFDADVWERFKCNVFCHIADDGTVDNGSRAAIDAQIDEDELGVAALILHWIVNIMGNVGMTNAGRSGASSGDDCDDCGCGCTTVETYQAESEDFTGGTVGLNGSFNGRFVDDTLTLSIPDRAGRTVAGVFVGITGAAGSGSMTVTCGGVDSDESPVPRTGLENLLHHWTPSQDDDDIVISLSGDLSYHIDYLNVYYDC